MAKYVSVRFTRGQKNQNKQPACAGLALYHPEEVLSEFCLAQPGGTIAVHVKKQAGKIGLLSISGKVTFGDVMRYEC